ncbi:unnamed protein product, partial [Clonostachys rosea]
MRLAHLTLILLPLLAWAVQQSPTPSVETLDSISPHPDPSPRAAIVAVVEESDLSDLEVSVRQLEASFNARYHYPWVFFSTKHLSENFRQVVSNATNSVCFYEVLTPDNHARDELHDLASPAHCHQRPSRHNLDSFAKQGRMRDYEWFWRVEPGALFTQYLEFDIFRFMQDRKIAYGWLAGLRLYWLDDASSHLPQSNSSRAEKDTLQFDGTAGTCDLITFNMDGGHFNNSSGLGIPLIEGDGDLVNFGADWKQTCVDGAQAEAVDCLGPRTELGSIAFFQSEGHGALIQHSLNKYCDAEPTDTPDEEPTESFAVLGPRSTKFLPRYSLGTSRGVTRGIKPKFSKPTPAPVVNVLLYHVAVSMEKHHSHWDLIYREIGQPPLVPGLMSGNTVIDNRNFKPSYMWSIQCMLGTD